MRIYTSLFSGTALLVAAAFAALPSWTKADASVVSADVQNCTQYYPSMPYRALEQNQIFVLGNQRCAGRWTVYVKMTAQAQHSDAEGSELSVSIHPIFARQGDHILQTGSDLCEGRPGSHDSHFDNAEVTCSVTRGLSAGERSELSVHFFSNATKNATMTTWWTYEPGL